MKVIRVLVAIAVLGAASATPLWGQTPPQPPAAPAAPGQGPVGPSPTISNASRTHGPSCVSARRSTSARTPRFATPSSSWPTRRLPARCFGDVVVVLGNLRLEPTAVVEGEIVVVGGVVTVMPGARLEHDFAVVGGALEAPPGFSPRGEYVMIGPPEFGQAMRDVTPWFTRGLLWGRVIVPGLPWVWTIVGIVLLLNVVIAAAFPGAVTASANTLATRPLATAVVGMLSLLLFAPIVTILAISVVGIIVIPFVSCALVIAWMLGKVSVAQFVGSRVIRQDDPDSRGQALRSMLIGFVLICLVYMVPLLGLAAWAMIGVLGLGAATLTAMAGLKRERPAPPPQPVAPPPVPGPGPSGPGGPIPDFAPMASASVDPFLAESSAPVSAAAASGPAPPPFTPAPAAAAISVGDLLACPKAAFLDRFVAAVLDVFLVAMAYNLLDFNVWRNDVNMFFLLLIAYHIVFWAWKGTTVGGIVCSLRLVKTNGTALQPADAVVRGLAGLFSVAALGLGFLWILRDPERQSWHDRIAGTYVVSVPRSWPLP